MDGLVEDACAEIGREIGALCIPRLAGVVLGGGYGRGEGGAIGDRLSNDLDFFAVTEEGATDADAAAIAAALEPISRRWTAHLGIDVDFTGRTPWRLKHDEERIMVQELVRGYFDVAGKKGVELFAGIAKIDAAKLPWMEAARLMMNRGMGLLLARCRAAGASAAGGRISDADRDFVNRNINKCVLGSGDAVLVARGCYRWRAEARRDALADWRGGALYARAVAWKFRPSAAPVCDWETARAFWLAAHAEVLAAAGAADRRRTLRRAARWLVRRRTLGAPATFGQDPVVRVLARVARGVRDRQAPSRALRRDWEVFN